MRRPDTFTNSICLQMTLVAVLIAGFGLSHPPAAQAGGCTPPDVSCLAIPDCQGGTMEVYPAGTPDNFCLPTEPATPGAILAASPFCNNSVDFDEVPTDDPFCHTIGGLPDDITEASLQIRIRANSSSLACNDSLGLQVNGGNFVWARRLGTGGGGCGGSVPPGLLSTPWSPGATNTFCLNLGALPNADGSFTNLIPYLNSSGRLDIRTQDDSLVDYAELHIGRCPCTDPPGGMVGWWTLDEPGGTAFDIIGGNDGTIVNAAYLPPGKVAAARDFDGSGDFVVVPDTSDTHDFGSGAFSIDAWIKGPFNASATGMIVSKFDQTTGFGYEFFMLGGTPALFMQNGIAACQVFGSFAPFPGDWIHVTVAVSECPRDVQFYIDGIAAGGGPLSCCNVDNDAALRIGRGPISAPDYDGPIDEVEIFDVQLTQAEVLDIVLADSAGKCKCEPIADATACTDILCPDDTEQCLPGCVIVSDLVPPLPPRVVDCECRDPNACHVEFQPGGDPICVGGCPNGQGCIQTTTVNADGTTQVCCDCIPQPFCGEIDELCMPQALQDECAQAPDPNGICRPQSMTIQMGMPIADTCECLPPGDCGPVQSMEEFPGGPLLFRCDQVDCEDAPGELCQIFIDGIPQGVPAISQLMVPEGGQVTCDCPESACPLPNDGTPALCEALQFTDCDTGDPMAECRPTAISLVVGAGGVLEPRADECACGECYAEYDPANMTVDCISNCPPGENCVQYAEDFDGDGIDDHFRCSCEVDCCLPNGTCTSLPALDCEMLSGTPVPLCLGDANVNGVDDACEDPCPLPNGPVPDLCAALQSVDCNSSDPEHDCLPVAILVGPMGPEALECSCSGCYAEYTPGTVPPVTCVDMCPPGTTCTQISVDVDMDGIDDRVECRCEVECCLPDGTCMPTTDADCAIQGGTVVPACLGDTNSNGIDDACDVDCCLVNPPGICVTVADIECEATGGTQVPACLGDANTNGIDDACEGPDLCPVPPPIEPLCANFQATDCETDDPTASLCLPRAFQVGPALPEVTACGCCEEDCCTIQLNADLLECTDVCPMPDDVCQIHLDGMATGDTSIVWNDPDYVGLQIDCRCAPVEEVGACCFDADVDGFLESCSQVTFDECTALGGNFNGVGSPCLGVGACCRDGATGPECILADGLCCMSVNGFFQGVGTVCQGLEACCFSDGSCSDIDATCCEDLGGTPGGAGSDCMSFDCPSCDPEPDGQACTDYCPVAGAVCQPSCVTFNPISLAYEITDCACKNECFVDITPGAPPKCSGICGIGETCAVDFTMNADGTWNLCCGNCVPPLVCADDDVALCADVDADGIRDNNCRWYDCVSGVCQHTDVNFADMGGPNGSCPPDGTADANDRFHVLNCFSDQTTQGTPGYPCESGPPQAYNVDVAGLSEPCRSDGVCDANDAFAALNTFSGMSPCGCPGLPGGPAPVAPPAGGADGTQKAIAVPASAALSLQVSDHAVSGGERIAVDVFLNGSLADLRGYQLHLGVQGGRRGQLELADIAIHPRADYVFNGIQPWTAFNLQTAQMLAGLTDHGIAVNSDAKARSHYLATFIYRASKDAEGDFVITVLHDRTDPAQRSALIPTAPLGTISIESSESAAITVARSRNRRQ